MKRLFHSLILVVLAGVGFAQNPAPPVTTSQLNIPFTAPVSVTAANVAVIGNPGPQTYYYWIVANYLVGSTSPSGPFLAANAPTTLSGSNSVSITPNYPAGLSSVDLLRTTSPVAPTGNCNCAVSTAVTGGTILDVSNSLSSYTVAPGFVAPNYTFSLVNQPFGLAATHLWLQQNGILVNDLSIGGNGNVSGPASSVSGNIAIWNNVLGTLLGDSTVAFPLGNSSLLNPSLTVNGTAIALGGSGTITAAPSGTASGDLGGNYPAPTMNGVDGVPLCTGFTPTNGQALQYTTASSPNPCWTAGTVGSLTNPMTTLGDVIYGGASGVPARLAGATSPNGVPEVLASIPVGGVAVAPILALPGIVGRSVTGASDTIVSTDCNPKRVTYTGSAAVAVTLPTPTTLGVGSCSFKIANNTTNTVTVTPTTWTISAGSGGTPGATLAILEGQEAILFVDPKNATNWAADVSEQMISAGSNIALTRSVGGVSIAVAATPSFGATTVTSFTNSNDQNWGGLTWFVGPPVGIDLICPGTTQSTGTMSQYAQSLTVTVPAGISAANSGNCWSSTSWGNFTGHSISFKHETTATNSAVGTAFLPAFEVGLDATHKFNVYVYAVKVYGVYWAPGICSGNGFEYMTGGGVNCTDPATAYTPNTYKFFRLCEATATLCSVSTSGHLSVDYSADGATWTDLGTIAPAWSYTSNIVLQVGWEYVTGTTLFSTATWSLPTTQ
jgi:hypothetical protein